MLFFFFLLDENGRPMTALKNDVSFSDLKLPVEEWLIGDFKVRGQNEITQNSVWFYTEKVCMWLHENQLIKSKLAMGFILAK